MKYEILYADPPWPYEQTHVRGSHKKHYESMTLPHLKVMKLFLNPMLADNCALFMWATHPMLREALDLIQSWKFEFITTAFIWVKTTKYTSRFFTGNGFYTRSNTELVLLAKRGSIKPVRRDIHQIITSPVREHSEKPDMVRKRIVELMGDKPRLELFGRKKIHGWDVWGNDSKVNDLSQLSLEAAQ